MRFLNCIVYAQVFRLSKVCFVSGSDLLFIRPATLDTNDSTRTLSITKYRTRDWFMNVSLKRYWSFCSLHSFVVKVKSDQLPGTGTIKTKILPALETKTGNN